LDAIGRGVAKELAQLKREGENNVWNNWCGALAHVVARIFCFPRDRGIYPHSFGSGGDFNSLSSRRRPLGNRLIVAGCVFFTPRCSEKQGCGSAFLFSLIAINQVISR
jgi:hypothetical protein